MQLSSNIKLENAVKQLSRTLEKVLVSGLKTTIISLALNLDILRNKRHIDAISCLLVAEQNKQDGNRFLRGEDSIPSVCKQFPRHSESRLCSAERDQRLRSTKT